MGKSLSPWGLSFLILELWLRRARVLVASVWGQETSHTTPQVNRCIGMGNEFDSAAVFDSLPSVHPDSETTDALLS